MKSVLSLVAAVAFAGLVPETADAGLFGCFNKHNSYDACCEPVEPCCAPAPVSCCAPAPVYHHAAAPCCGHVAHSCAPDPCCDPCARPRKGLFGGLFKCFRKHDQCDTCCAPQHTGCGVPAYAGYGAPAPAYYHNPSSCCGH